MAAKNVRWIACAAATGVLLATHSAVARMDVTVEFDRSFDFRPVSTWGWTSAKFGDVKMARTAQDDPEAMRQRAEPIIVDAVTSEIGRRGLKASISGNPDITVTYFLLLATTLQAQTMGQFLPATTGWGLPPFASATQSLKMMNSGSLVLDLSAGGVVVWRGLAQADIKFDADAKKRESLLRQAVRELLAKYPPRR